MRQACAIVPFAAQSAQKTGEFGQKCDIQKCAAHKDVPPRFATYFSPAKKRFLLPWWWVGSWGCARVMRFV